MEQDKSGTTINKLERENTVLYKALCDLERRLQSSEKALEDMKEKWLFGHPLMNEMREQHINDVKMTKTSLKRQIDILNKEINALNNATNGVCERIKEDVGVLGKVVQEFLQEFVTIRTGKHTEVEEILRKSEETVAEYEKTLTNLKVNEIKSKELERLLKTSTDFKQRETSCEELERLLEDAKEVAKLSNLEEQLIDSEKSRRDLEEEMINEELFNKVPLDLAENEKEVEEYYERYISDLITANLELVSIVTAEHQENEIYHNEIEQLTQILKVTIEDNLKLQVELETKKDRVSELESKVDKIMKQNAILEEQCEYIAQNISKEQNEFVEYSVTRIKEPVPFRAHLVETEAAYTQDKAEKDDRNMETKVDEIKESENFSTPENTETKQELEEHSGQIQEITSQWEE